MLNYLKINNRFLSLLISTVIFEFRDILTGRRPLDSFCDIDNEHESQHLFNALRPFNSTKLKVKNPLNGENGQVSRVGFKNDRKSDSFSFGFLFQKTIVSFLEEIVCFCRQTTRYKLSKNENGRFFKQKTIFLNKFSRMNLTLMTINKVFFQEDDVALNVFFYLDK